MKGATIAILVLVPAATGTAFLLHEALWTPAADLPPTEPAARSEERSPASEAPRHGTLRAYATTATLVEDLRDSLGEGPDGQLAETCAHVSAALGERARWTLLRLAPTEDSPRVRALLVWCAGVHLPEDAALLRFLEDRAPVVRRACVVAIGHRPEGAAHVAIADALPVAVGRVPGSAVEGLLRSRWQREEDAGVREAIAEVLRAAGLSPPR